jgi:hypothetical protein
MVGWFTIRRIPRERQQVPLRGYKLAYPVVSADGTEAGFTGVSLGRSRAYGITADAECVGNAAHHCPATWCGCGFYCFHSLSDARALACDSEYQHSVLLEVEARGHYIRCEKGLRYSRQTVAAVRAGRCGCGWPANAFADAGDGLVGWRRLLPLCAACAASRPVLSLEEFARLAGGVSISRDEQALAWAANSVVPASDSDMIPLLSAEAALLHARLDQLQSQLDRLTGEH